MAACASIHDMTSEPNYAESEISSSRYALGPNAICRKLQLIIAMLTKKRASSASASAPPQDESRYSISEDLRNNRKTECFLEIQSLLLTDRLSAIRQGPSSVDV